MRYFQNFVLLGRNVRARYLSTLVQPIRNPVPAVTVQLKDIDKRDDFKAIIDFKESFADREIDPEAEQKLQNEDHFDLWPLIDVEEMFRRNVHLGHKAGTLSEPMRKYLYGERLGMCIFDLDLTAKYLFTALNVLAHVVDRGGVILFASGARNHAETVEALAERVGEYAHTRKFEKGTLLDATAKFAARIRLPDLIVFTHTLNNVFEPHELMWESTKMTIPSIAIVDSNCDPLKVTYPIPANDDTRSSVNYFCKMFETTVLRAKGRNTAL